MVSTNYFRENENISYHIHDGFLFIFPYYCKWNFGTPFLSINNYSNARYFSVIFKKSLFLGNFIVNNIIFVKSNENNITFLKMSYTLWLLCIISILIRKIREQKAVWEMHIINPLIFIVFFYMDKIYMLSSYWHIKIW